ncbi:unnamed protein product [Bursaphelenchus xylophilus]|uniref:(pine wood nematode) hypothetical protein n=1 Tax=Bursaphelenchus xylophilus TaxID=6326 RepID=A0A7I8XEX3_BURXY|nr:unnamed protein product [Bursaphelenchus xylophilus]CAG9079886.1 unnamed protein product [Bursaphelenchus xylophilus]
MTHKPRAEWGNQYQFILTSISYAVGLGNIWRFPALVYEQKGGAFLIPYFICSFVVGFPILYMELSLGQFAKAGPAVCYGRIRPILQGLGWAMVMLSLLVSIYYNMIVAWSLIYIFMVVTGQSWKWSSCENDFNTIYCSSGLEDARCTNEMSSVVGHSVQAFYFNGTCHLSSDISARRAQAGLFAMRGAVSPAEEFFENFILERNPTLDGLGGLNWKLLLAYFIAWTITTLSLSKGVKLIGKLAYFTSTVPYIIIVILFVRSVTLDGAYIGMDFYLFSPDLSTLLNLSTWRAAATHVSYSLSVGFGGILSLASYNVKTHNCYRDAFLVTVADAIMSLFGGTAVFSVLGFMSHQLDLPISEVVQSGTGLAFVAYPEALARMPWSGLWSFLFFVMIWILGVSTQFGYGEVLVTALSDQFPFVARHKFPTAIVGCFTLFCCGLVMCTRSGIYFFNIFNDYSSSFSLEIVLCLEALLLCHIYGYSNYKLDLEEMFGKAKTKLGKVFGPTGIWISIVWKYLAPLLAIVIFIFSLLTQIQTDLTYGKGARLYRLPRWCIGFGWCISVLPLTFLPIFAVYNFYKFKKRNLPIAELFKVQPKWPSANRHREADGVERTSL